jgi:hypothetical protein
MPKSIIAFLIIVLSINIFPSDENYSLKYSKYIPINSPFDISLITSKIFPTANELVITCLSDSKTTLNSVELRSENVDQKIPFTVSKGGVDLITSVTKINFNDSIFSSSEFFQILFKFKSESVTESQIKFKAAFYEDNVLLGYLFNSNDNNEKENEASVKISFYKPQNVASSCLELKSNSKLSIDLRKDSLKNVLIQFWFKNQEQNNNFVKLSDRISGKTQFELGVNKYQMLEVRTLNQSIDIYDAFFVSSQSWSYLTFHLSFEEKKIYLYCNSILFARLNLSFDFISETTQIDFYCTSSDKPIQIEQLRLIDYRKKQIKDAFAYSSTKEFLTDSSNVLLHLDFDDVQKNSVLNQSLIIKEENVKHVFSDAPLYPLSPEVKVNIFSHYNEIQWHGGDYKTANKYILEKSVSGSTFLEIYSVDTDNESDKIYSFIDEQELSSEITYYRIKTVKKDGAIFISNQLKVGQGYDASFNLIQNYPNPFNPKTSIEFDLFIDTDVEITVYNLEGKLVQTIFNGFLVKGNHKFDFDASELSSGIYLYKVSTPISVQVKKMLLAK